MLDAKVQFTCSHCREVVEVKLEDLKIINHPASPYPCGCCGYEAWTEYKTSCPNCKQEVSTL